MSGKKNYVITTYSASESAKNVLKWTHTLMFLMSHTNNVSNKSTNHSETIEKKTSLTHTIIREHKYLESGIEIFKNRLNSI